MHEDGTHNSGASDGSPGGPVTRVGNKRGRIAGATKLAVGELVGILGAWAEDGDRKRLRDALARWGSRWAIDR